MATVGMGVPVMSEAAQFGTGQVFLSMLWFFLFLIWICLLVAVFADIFRSHDLGGWGKALWTIFVIVLPYLGVFVYLIARGGKMSERRADSAWRRTAWHASSSGVASDMAVTERRVT
jgi:predicted permease